MIVRSDLSPAPSPSAPSPSVVPVQIGITSTHYCAYSNSNHLILLNWTYLLEDDMMEDSSDYVEPSVQTEEPGIPIHQRAWREVRRGEPKFGLELQTDVPVSTQLGPGEVLVKVKAAALNPGYVCLMTCSQITQTN